MHRQHSITKPNPKERKALLGFCLCLVLASPAISSPGPLLYATQNAETGSLLILSKTNAALARVGSFGMPANMFDLAYDSQYDILYASGNDPAIFINNLYTIDRARGAARLIGSFGVPLMYGLAYNPRDGRLYGATAGSPDSRLYLVDTNSGNATVVGSTGIFSASGSSIHGLAFNPADGELYGCLSGREYLGGIVRIDTATGEATFLYECQPLMDLAFDPETGTLFGIDNGVGVYPDGLYTIDLPTGSASLVRRGVGNAQGLAFAMPPPPRLRAVLLSPPHLLVTWPTNYRSYTLESATDFPAMAWTQVTNQVETFGEQFGVAIAAETSQRVFRLRSR